MAEASGAFAQAYDTVQHVEDIVDARLKESKELAEALRQSALSTISQLSGVNVDIPMDGVPQPPSTDTTIDVDFTIPEVSVTDFGGVGQANPIARPNFASIPTIPDLNIPEFSGSISSINIPTAPAWVAPTAPPPAPVVGTVDLPDMPALAMPAAPTLAEITVPDFNGLTLPTFSATAPEFEATALPGILQWSEPEYHTEVLDEVITQLRRMWAGGSGIPEAVEQAMWARAADREDLSAARDIDAVSEEYSLRGFTMPSGMQAARADQLRQDLAVKKLGMNRDITIQVAQWQVENMRFACEQGIAAENVLVNIFLNQAQRAFEVARYRVEAQLNVYNAQVALFNARMNGYQVSAQIFNTLVQAELTKIEVFKAEVEAEVSRGQLNTQKVQAYTAMVDALKAQTEVYRTQMQGAEVKAGLIRNDIEIYRTKIQAYAEQVGAQKTMFDAYESQVKGEAAKAGIIDAEARAYAALVQGKSAVADIGIKRVESVIQGNRGLVDMFQAEIELEKVSMQAKLSGVQASAQAFVADTQRFAAMAQAEGAKAQVLVTAKEAEIRTNVALYQAQVQAYIGTMEQMIRKASLSLDAIKAAGSMASTLAAGAMAGVHVGATLSGSGSVAASGADTYSKSWSKTDSRSENYNYEGT